MLPKKQRGGRYKLAFWRHKWHALCFVSGMQKKISHSTPPPPASFGSNEASAWQLQNGTVDLSRPAAPPRLLQLAAGACKLQLDVSRSLIVVVDMQNDFCHREGWFAQKGISMRATRKPIPMLKKLLPAWRAAGARVLWLNWGIRQDKLNLPPTVHFKGKGGNSDGVGYGEASPLDHGLSVVQNHWGAEVISDLPVAPKDIQVNKHRLSGFWDNELDSILRAQGITTLLFAGINTDRCVFSTLQDAAFLGYDCILLKDACSTPSPAYVTRAIHFLVEQCHGFVASAADLHISLTSQKKES